jgi:hypothetical protein
MNVAGWLLLAQTEDAPTFTQQEVTWLRWCGGSANAPEDADRLCFAVARITGNEWLATLAPPLLRIAVIHGLAIGAQLMLRRAIGRFVRRTKERGLKRIEALTGAEERSDVDIARATMRAETIAGVLRSIAAFAIWIIVLLVILSEFDINLAPLIAGAGIAGVAIGFGAQTLVRDFLSGIFMLVEDQYGIGDIINTGEATGVVEPINVVEVEKLLEYLSQHVLILLRRRQCCKPFPVKNRRALVPDGTISRTHSCS